MSGVNGYYFKSEGDVLSDPSSLKQKYMESYLRLSQRDEIYNGDVTRAITLICKVAQNILKVSQVSFWRYLPEEDGLACEFVSPMSSLFSHKLSMQIFPNYGRAIRDKGVVVAHNAQEFEITREMNDAYLRPYGIESMLDSPVILGQSLLGVLCCEHSEGLRLWTPEEVLFVNLLSHLISYAEQSKKLRSVNEYIHRQFRELDEMHKTVSQANLNLSGEVVQLNEKLARHNKLLLEQNQKLRDYARLNSHSIRSPLANLLGLIELAKVQPEFAQDQEWRKFIEMATLNLDEQVHEMNSLLEGDQLIKEILQRGSL